MKRRHFHPSACWRCGATAESGVHISQTGLCPPCSTARVGETYDSLKAKAGRDYRRWKHRLEATMAALPD